jgi:serine/threonine-protein kinase
VLETLGQGGMGIVYAAYDPELDRKVAVKLLREHPHDDDGAAYEHAKQARLAREAKAMARLSHPNVVAVYDVGTHEGRTFVAMELVPGQTLRAWLKSSRSWHEKVEMFVAAGRGLAAAHAAGIVHRDFKPDNVLVGEDGRPRVADFGLAFPTGGRTEKLSADAAIAGYDVASASSSTSSIVTTWDRRALVGTPRYMSPEQILGEGADAGADQFAFAVSLWEALYGASPFAGQDALTVLANIRGGNLDAPKARDVPGWLRAVLARGLAAKAADRYTSMDALIDALERDPARARRRWLAAAGAVATCALVWVAAARTAPRPPDPCAHPEDELRGAWDDTVKGRVAAAFGATGRPYAADTTARVDALLDRYAASWAAMRGAVCVASRDATQSRDIVTLRDACLDRRHGQLAALTALLAEKPDPDVLDKAVPAAAGLLPVDYCADTEALLARVRPPEDPAVRAAVAALQPRVDRLEALYTGGKYKEGIAASEPLLSEAAALPYPPLRAQVAWWEGQFRERSGDYEGAKAMLRDAASLAADGHDDVLAAQAWGRVYYVLGERQRRFDEASAIDEVAPTLLARARDDRARVAWLTSEGVVLWRMTKLQEANAKEEEALAYAEKIVGPDHPSLATVLNNLGNVRRDMNDLPGALAVHERALAIREKALGPEHPAVAQSSNNLGLVLEWMDDYPAARAAYQRALDVWERALGPDHPDVAQAANNLGGLLEEMGDWDDAAAFDERALAVREKTLGPDHPDIAQSLVNLAAVASDRGDHERAVSLCQRALAVSEKALGSTHHDLAYSLACIGRADVRLARYDAASTVLARALAIVDVPGAKDELLGQVLLGEGELALARGRAKDARGPLQRALGIVRGELGAEVRLALADALFAGGSDDDRARATQLAAEARATFEKIGHRPGSERATRWLEAHHASGER